MKEKGFYKELGRVLRETREEHNMTQQQIADRLGVTKTTISRYESGNRQMYADTLQEYCKAMGVSIQSVFDKL